MHYFCLHVLLLLVSTIVRAQTTTRLPPAPSYRDGVFTSPNTFNTQILDKASEINVTWTTTYKTVNLFLIFGQDYVSSRALRIATTDTFFLWTVDDFGNNSLPFSFRAVNSAGTAQEQAGGGFYTGQFWVRDGSETSSVALQAAVVTTTENASSSMTAATTTAQLSNSATSGSSSITIDSSTRSTSFSSSSSVTSSSAGLPSTTSPVSESVGSSSELSALRTDTPASSPGDTQDPTGPSTGAISGIVVGAVAVLAMIIGVSLYFRRQRRPTTSSRHLDSLEMQMAQDDYSSRPRYTLRDLSLSSFKRRAELQDDEVVELPNNRSSRPHELA